MDRREFLTRAGRIVVVLPAGYAFACGSSTSSKQDGGRRRSDGGGARDAGGRDMRVHVGDAGGRDGRIGDAGPGGDAGAGASQAFMSTTVNGHHHDYLLRLSEVNHPPAGGTMRETTMAEGHTHVVTLTMAQLSDIHAGRIVTVRTSVVNAHQHAFTFRLA